MGVLGELFPGRKIADESGEAGAGEKWHLGPIDLEGGTVVLHRGGGQAQADETEALAAEDADD